MTSELEEVQAVLRRVVEIAQEPAWRPQGKGQGAQGTPEQQARLHVLSKLLRIRRLTENDYVRVSDDEIMMFSREILTRRSPKADMTADAEEDTPACGYVYDHDVETTFEDDDLIQWSCRRCGAEGWEDKA